MKSGDVGALFARLGVTLDADSINSATAELNRSFGGMSAAMKRETKAGAESLRLVGESLDIHMSRPLARVIAQIPGVGTALASLGGATFGTAGIIAIGAYIGEKLVPYIETAAKKYGLIGESADEMGKRVTSALEDTIKSLQRAADMQDKYNRLVLDLKGGAFEQAHIENLKKESDELQKQTAQLLEQQVIASQSQTWWQSLLNKIAETSGTAGALVPSHPNGKYVPLAGNDEAVNKIGDALKVVNDRLHQVMDEMTVSGWQKFRDDTDAATKALDAFNKKMLEFKMHTDQGITNPGEFAAWEQQRINGMKMPAGPAPQFAAPAMPLYGGTTQAMDLFKLQTDQESRMSALRDIINSVNTPEEKYLDTLKRLSELMNAKDGPVLTQDQYNRAVLQAGEALEQAQKKVDKWQGGLKAFYDDLKQQTNAGRFTFDILRTGLQGFENETIQSLLRGRADWKAYFDDIAAMALKFVMDKAFTQLFGNLLGGKKTDQMAAAATQMAAGTLMTSAAATQLTAANIMAASGGGGIGAGWGAIGSLAGMLASGGDVTPGSSYLVGEAGPEIFTPGSSGIVSPIGGGDTNYYIDARNAQNPAEVELRVRQAINESHRRAVAEAVTLVSEQQKRRRF